MSVYKLTINGGVVFGLNRGLTRGTFKSPRPESTVSLRLTHIFYKGLLTVVFG